MELGVVLVWWVAFVASFVLGWPLAARVLRESPDRGASVAVPVAFVVVFVPTLWVGQVSFDAGIVVALVALVAASVVAWRRFEDVPWREFAVTVLVFSVAFGFMLVLRAAAPGIYPGGGEKFLDFGLFQSLLRADRLPPMDMWFAGKRVVYYYGGHMLAAVLAKVTMTPGRWAKVPMLAGWYALEVTAVYGLAQAIVADRSDAVPDAAGWRVRVGAAVVAFVAGAWAFGLSAGFVLAPAVFAVFASSLSPARRAGVLSAFAFGFASNLLTPARLAARHLPGWVHRWVLSTVGPSRDLDPTVSAESFSYWPSSRVIPNTINEFPLFAYRNGDMHAHMMSPTLLLVLAAILFAFYRAPVRERGRRAALLAATVPISAAILAVNTWSFPTALGLVALGVAGARAGPWTLLPWFRDASPGRVTREAGRVVAGVLVAGVVGALALVAVWPFVVNVLLEGVGGRHLAFLPTRSGLGPFVLVHGAFLASFSAYLVARGTSRRRGTALAVAAIPVLVAAGWYFDLVGLLLVGPLVVGGWWALRTGRAGYEALLVVAGGGLVVLVEFAYLADNAAPSRFNTVFKVYFQVWTLWAVALGVALARFAGRVRDLGDTRWRHLRRLAGPVAVAFLLVTVSVYGGLVTSQHVGNASEYSLDGFTYAHTYHPQEAEAIEWVNDLEGQPTLASKPCTAVYTWCNPASSLTGVPTVLGWGHEAIYRGNDAYQERQLAVRILFETEEAYSRAVLIRKYDVEYIYVSPRERAEYDVGNMVVEPGISVAFRNEKVTIYAVNESALVENPS